ncbi:MAG TPA: RNA polymerase subunit sigma-70 [Stenotrophomonas sp.]|nr:RNA polymerase subunit sigma-70 [Stenotrophomonas sp.]
MDAIEQELWRRHRQEGDAEARDFLFLRYSGWARSVAAAVARRAGPRMMEWNDHVQNAQVGLLEAMSRFDPILGVDFMAYAKPRVRGAVFNGMRSFMRADAADSRRRVTMDRLESLKDAEDEPLAAFVKTVAGLGLGLLLEGQLDNGAEGETSMESYSPVLRDALLGVPERRRDILVAHYIRQIPFQDIAREMGVTKGRVSQLHKEGLAMLREVLRERRYGRDSFF